MAEEKIIIGRIKNKKDNYNNWYNSNPILLNGEIGIVKNSNVSNISMLIVGDGDKNFQTLLQDETNSYYPEYRSTHHAIFYSGIGAGYQLPSADANNLGGIKINSAYFTMENDYLAPTKYRYLNNYNDKGPTIDFGDANLKAKDIFVTNTYKNTDFIIELNYSVEGGNIVYMDTFNNPFAGVVIHNYKENTNACFGMNYNGLLLFNSNYNLDNNNLNSSNVILNIPMNSASGLVHFENNNIRTTTIKSLTINQQIDGVPGEPFVYNPLDEDQEITINTVNDYCTTIIANNTEYKVDNHIITLGTSIWSDDLLAQLNTATADITTLKTTVDNIPSTIPNKIIFNNTEYTPVNQTFTIDLPSYDQLVTITSEDEDVITVEKNNGYVIKHDNIDITKLDDFPKEYDINDENNEFVVTNISICDDKGHIQDKSYTKYKFQALLDRITALEKKVAELEEK